MGYYIEVQFGGVTTGEIHTASYFEITGRLDEAGSFDFEMPLTDPNASLIVSKAVVICYHEVAGAMVIFGAGIVDNIEVAMDAGGSPTGALSVSGPDLLREFAYIQVGKEKINAVNTGPTQLIALAPAWSLSGVGLSTKTITHQYSREYLLDAFIKLAEIDGGHIYYDPGLGWPGITLRRLMWIPGSHGWVPGGLPGSEKLRAFYGIDALAAEGNIKNCVVTSLNKTSDSANAMVGRIYAFGCYDGDTALNLNGAAIAVPGYSIGYIAGKGYYLEHALTWATYGIESVVNYSDEEDKQSLCDRTYEDMDRQLVPHDEYDISVVGLTETIQVLDVVRLMAYQWSIGASAYSNFKTDILLNVIEKTDRVDNAGARTVNMKLSTKDKPVRKNKHALNTLGKIVFGMKNHNT